MEVVYRALLTAALLLTPPLVRAADTASLELLDLGRKTQRTQEQTLEFERDLQVLESELAAPVNAPRLEIYLALSAGRYFRLDRLDLDLDGKPLTRHDYDLRMREALRAGGTQLLYRGPLPRKAQRLRVRYVGQGGVHPYGETVLDVQPTDTGLLVELGLDDAPAVEATSDSENSETVPRRTELNAHVWEWQP